MHERREALVAVQRKIFPAVADETRVAAPDRHVGALVLVGVEINVFHLADDLAENHRELREPFHIFDPRNRRRLRFRQLVALPDFEMLVRLAHKKNFAVVRVERVRREQQNGFLLMHAGEIKQIGVLQMAHRAVGVRGHDVVGVEQGQRARQEFFDEASAVQREQRGRNGNWFHGKICIRPKG